MFILIAKHNAYVTGKRYSDGVIAISISAIATAKHYFICVTSETTTPELLPVTVGSKKPAAHYGITKTTTNIFVHLQ